MTNGFLRDFSGISQGFLSFLQTVCVFNVPRLAILQFANEAIVAHPNVETVFFSVTAQR